MKKAILLISLFMIGVFLAVNIGCESPLESCESDTACDGKEEYTACCTDGQDCVYKYNGKEYTSVDALYDAMNCSSKKNGTVSCDENEIKQRIRDLLEKARVRSMQ